MHCLSAHAVRLDLSLVGAKSRNQSQCGLLLSLFYGMSFYCEVLSGADSSSPLERFGRRRSGRLLSTECCRKRLLIPEPAELSERRFFGCLAAATSVREPPVQSKREVFFFF